MSARAVPVAAPIATALIDLDGEAPVSRALALLEPAERARAAAYRIPRDGRRFAVRRAWLRRLLAAETGIPAAELRFAANAYGKPHLPVCLELSFSVSHSAGWALAAVSRAGPVGCDIERRDPAKADPAVAERFFSPRERAELARLSGTAWIHGFFAAWTRKEAWVKALGTGLSLPLQSFSVSLGSPARLTEGAIGWGLGSVAAPSGFSAALAYRL